MIRAAFWSFLDRFLFQLINFAIAILIARFLGPTDLATIAIVTAYIYILNILVDSGLTISIIRSQNITDAEVTSIFVFNLILSLFFIILTLIFSSFIERFLEIDNLSYYLNISSVILFINAFSFVRYAKLEQAMNFKLAGFINLGAIIIGGCLCVFLLYQNYGILAVVIFYIIISFIKSLFYLIFTPKFRFQSFSFSDLRPHLHFGKNLIVSSGVEAIYNHSFPVLITKIFTGYDAGLFFQSKRLVDGPVGILSSASRRMFLPSASLHNNDIEKTKTLLYQTLKIVNYITIFLLGVLFINADFIVTILMGEKWSDAVPIFKVLMFGMLFYAPFFLCIDVFKVHGDSSSYSKIILNTRMFAIILILCSSFGGFMWLVYFFAIAQFLMFIYVSFKIQNKFSYSITNILKTIIPYIFTMVIGIFLINLLEFNVEFEVLYLGIKTLLFFGFYIAINHFIFKYNPILFLLQNLKK